MAIHERIGHAMTNSILIRSNFDLFFLLVNSQLPPHCTWQTLRDKFREIGEVKFAEIRGQDCGVVRFSKERDAELAISEYCSSLY